MYTDKCMILPIVKDSDTGAETVGTAFESDCRVEKEDKTKRSSNGLLEYSQLYILPRNTEIAEGYKIKAIKISGVTVVLNYALVAKAFPVGNYHPHHWEVYVK